MEHPNRSWREAFVAVAVCVMVSVAVCAVAGCSNVESNRATDQPSSKAPVSAKQQAKEAMKFAFLYPVVMVNGQRALRSETEYQEKVLVSFPQDAVQPITLAVMSDGEEKSIQGKIEVYRYTQHSKGGDGEEAELVWVAPKNPEYVYSNIIAHGYGELTVREGIRHEQGLEDLGPVVAKLMLGTKKKIDAGQIEFRFRENSVHSVNGEKGAVSLSFPEKSKQSIRLSIDEGEVHLAGDFEIFSQTAYTQIAPVWIEIPEETKQYLRARGGRAQISLCDPVRVPPDEDYVKMVEHKNLSAVSRQHGREVAVLTLRRVNQ